MRSKKNDSNGPSKCGGHHGTPRAHQQRYWQASWGAHPENRVRRSSLTVLLTLGDGLVVLTLTTAHNARPGGVVFARARG